MLKRVLTAAIALAMFLSVSTVAMAAAPPRDIGVHKAPLYMDHGWSCANGGNAIGDTHGFVVLRLDADGTLTGSMNLKGLTPGSEYWLWIAGRDIDGQTCSRTATIAFPVVADARGNLRFKFTFENIGPQESVWVGASGGGIRVQSPAVRLG
jgi:hypothetical protein